MMSTPCRSIAPRGRSARGLPLATAALFLACSPGEAPPAEMPTSGIQVAPPGSDVWIADLHWEQSGPPAIGEATNLTGRPGYDNQPHFTPDGTAFWYTAVDEQIGQADIWRYDLASGMVTRVTASAPESEYSATPLPNGTGVSVIRVEADSAQRLWRFDHDGANGSVLFPDLAPVGYHAWADETTALMFVLGDPPTLVRGNTATGATETLARDIGRSIQRIPDTNDVSFVQREPDGSSTIMRVSPGQSEPVPIIAGVEGGEFHAWAPDGTLLMAHESMVYAFTRGATDGWALVGDFSRDLLTISRLAVSPDGSQIALVAEVVF